jgi:hypothetical protein
MYKGRIRNSIPVDDIFVLSVPCQTRERDQRIRLYVCRLGGARSRTPMIRPDGAQAEDPDAAMFDVYPLLPTD